MPKPPASPLELRAAKLSHVPGMTIDEASERFRIGAAAIKRARKDPASKPSLAELALAALTYNGTQSEGELELARIAGWIDYLNHDACSEAEARALLESCAQLAIEGTRWRLLGEWP